MKKSAKSFEYCSGTRLKRAGTTVGKQKSPRTIKKKNESILSNGETPRAPHNTSSYLMDQQELQVFNPEELLGELLGTTFKQSGLKFEYILN